MQSYSMYSCLFSLSVLRFMLCISISHSFLLMNSVLLHESILVTCNVITGYQCTHCLTDSSSPSLIHPITKSCQFYLLGNLLNISKCLLFSTCTTTIQVQAAMMSCVVYFNSQLSPCLQFSPPMFHFLNYKDLSKMQI